MQNLKEKGIKELDTDSDLGEEDKRNDGQTDNDNEDGSDNI